jgi:hypothetical protein
VCAVGGVSTREEKRDNCGNRLACIGGGNTIGTGHTLLTGALRGLERKRRMGCTTLIASPTEIQFPLAQLWCDLQQTTLPRCHSRCKGSKFNAASGKSMLNTSGRVLEQTRQDGGIDLGKGLLKGFYYTSGERRGIWGCHCMVTMSVCICIYYHSIILERGQACSSRMQHHSNDNDKRQRA